MAGCWPTPAAQEVGDLLAVADRDLADCRAARLSDDCRFSIAYNAALQLATAALHASKYKVPRGQAHHLRAIQSLEFTVGLDKKTVDLLDAFRLKRNAGVYDRAGAVSRAEADAMIALAQALRQKVLDWLRQTYSSLAPSP